MLISFINLFVFAVVIHRVFLVELVESSGKHVSELKEKTPSMFFKALSMFLGNFLIRFVLC